MNFPSIDILVGSRNPIFICVSPTTVSSWTFNQIDERAVWWKRITKLRSDDTSTNSSSRPDRSAVQQQNGLNSNQNVYTLHKHIIFVE